MVEAAEPVAAERRERPYAQMVVFVPGIAALGLALLYATGALIKTAQLQDADVRVGDTLPLVPIEQLLALGIGTLMSSFVLVAIWAATVAIYVVVARMKRRKRGGTAPSTQFFDLDLSAWPGRAVRLGFLAAFGLLVVVTMTFRPFFEVIAAFTPVIAFTFGMNAADRGDPRRVQMIFVVAYLIVIAAKVGDHWYSPPPLADVTIETRDGTVEGSLIVARGDSWYVTSAPDEVELVPAARIVTATVKAPKPEEDAPAIPLWDWLR